MLRMLSQMLIQVSVRSARAGLAVAVPNGHAADDIFALRRAMRRRAAVRGNVAARMRLLAARVRDLMDRYDARRRSCAAIQEETLIHSLETESRRNVASPPAS